MFSKSTNFYLFIFLKLKLRNVLISANSDVFWEKVSSNTTLTRLVCALYLIRKLSETVDNSKKCPCIIALKPFGSTKV